MIGLACVLGCYSREENCFHYLFLGHPYDWGDPYRVDPRLEQLDYSGFDQVWLGGDVCSRLTEKESTLDYLDSLYDLRAAATHWTLGNHDLLFDNQQYITDRTGRPTFYTAWQQGICLMVLNTNLFWQYPEEVPQENCREKEAQLEMIRRVTDTVSKASHLVVLHHLGLLNELKKNEKGEMIKSFNVHPNRIRTTCAADSDFTPRVYPMLVKVQKRGVQVVMVGGDLGMRAKEFAYRTPEGIQMLGSGINGSVDPQTAPDYVTDFSPDKVLVLKHCPEGKSVDWEFVLLDTMGSISNTARKSYPYNAPRQRISAPAE